MNPAPIMGAAFQTAQRAPQDGPPLPPWVALVILAVFIALPIVMVLWPRRNTPPR